MSLDAPGRLPGNASMRDELTINEALAIVGYGRVYSAYNVKESAFKRLK